MNANIKVHGLIADGTSTTDPGFLLSGVKSPTSNNQIFVTRIANDFNISWEILSESNKGTTYSPENISWLSLFSSTLFGCGKANNNAIFMVL